MSETSESRKICDLKVPELRSELEKRDLDKTGVKAILLERLQNALLDEGEDPENYVFDKFELITEKNTKSPTVEKKENKTISTADKKPITPSKTVKTNVVGRRPGPKSKTCVPQLKADKSNISKKKNDEVKQEQADSSNVIACIEETKVLSLETSNVTDSNEAEAKETDANEVKIKESDDVDVVLCNENKMSDDGTNTTTSNIESAKESEKSNSVPVIIITKHTDNLKLESKETKQIKNSDSLNTNIEVSIKEEFSKTNEDLKEKDTDKTINDNNFIEIKEAIDEVNIHDEELDHEVDEEEINASSDDINQIDDTDKSIQENNKDDNNEDSINLTIGEDDIKLFADEEDTNIEKEDEVIENCTKEDASLIKQRETRHPVTASSGRATTGSVKSRRSTTEKRSSVGDKPRSSHKEDKDNSNTKPIISVSVPKEEKKEEEKQIKDKMDAGIKQSTDSKTPQISNDISKKNNASSVRNIWVSGLSSITKATDLKQLFSKYGKVVGAKVVTNAKTPGARCYGFVTLSSAEDANRSIENLHKTELHGRVISVERAKRDNGYQQTTKSSDDSKTSEHSEAERKNKKPEEKKDKREEKREKRPEITINDDKKPDISRDQKRSLSKDHNNSSQETKRSKIVIEKDDRRRDRSVKSKSNERDRDRLRELQRERERLEREKRRQQEILNFAKMKAERERQKQKEQERTMREEERKRRIEKERQLETERKQKEEALRLEKERQKLKIERDRIEKEKGELLRLERENQRLERERLQREKEELRRAQEKLEETKRQAALKRSIPSSPPPPKRHSSNSSRYDERKEPVRSSRVQPNTDYISQAAPPPPNITSSRHRYEQHSSDSRRSRPSPPPPPPPASRPKDSTVSMRYGAPPATDHHYRSREDRSDRREESRRKETTSSSSSSRHAHTSYDSSKSSYGISRNSESTWSSTPVKSSYNSISSNSSSSNMVMNPRPDPWSNSSSSREIETNVWQRPPQPPTDNRWTSTSSNPSSMSISGRSSSSNTLYVNNHQVIPNMGLNMSTNYSDNRFDSYKMSGMSRKY